MENKKSLQTKGAKYQMNGGIEHHGDKLALHVMVSLEGGGEVNALEEHIALASVSETLRQSANDAGQRGTETMSLRRPTTPCMPRSATSMSEA